MSLPTTLDSTLWLTGPVILDPATPFLHHIPVLKFLAARINTLWTQCQSQGYPYNDDQAQQANDHPKTRDLLAMSMILALRFSRVVLLQLPTHPRYQKRVHAAVLRPLVQEASKFLVQVEQYKADGGESFLASQVAESTEEPCETDRDENRTELPAVASSDLVPETTVEHSEVEAIHRSDVADIETNNQFQQEPPTPSQSSVNPGGATAQLIIATQIGTLPHPVSPTPTVAKKESPSEEHTPSPPLSKSIDSQATEKDTLQKLVSLASFSVHGDRQGGSSASPNKDLSSPKGLSTVSDSSEPRTTLDALFSSPTMSPTSTRPSYLRSAVERQSSIRRGLEADPYLITSSTAKLESAIREANRLIERGRRRSGSTTTPGTTSPSPSSSQLLVNSSSILPSTSFRPHISPADLNANEMAHKIADAEYTSAMRVEWDIAREIADRTGIFAKAKNTTNLSSYLEQETPLASGHMPRVATEPVSDTTVGRSYSAAAAAAEAADRPSVPKKEASRSASTTAASKPKVNFAESASAYSVRSKTSLYTSTASAVTPSLSSPSSPYVSRFGASLSAPSLPLSSSSSPKASTHSEANLITLTKAPRIHRLCMEPVPESPSIKKSPWEQGAGSAVSSSATSTTENARPRARQGSVSSLISAFEKKSEGSETSKDPPRRSYSASTLLLRPRPVSSYASLGSMPGPTTVVGPRSITAPIPVSAMARSVPTPLVRTPRVDLQKRHSSYLGDFRTLAKTRPVPVPAPVPISSSDNDTDVVRDIYVDDDIYDDDDSDGSVDLIRVATQSSVASSSTYLRSRSMVPSTMETPEGGELDKVKEDGDADAGEESEGSLQFLEVPDPLNSDEWIKNRTRTSLSEELSTSGSVKSTSETSEQQQEEEEKEEEKEEEEEEEDDDDDEPLGNHPSLRAWNMPSMRSMASGSTSSVRGDLDDDDVALMPPSPAFMAPFTWAQSRSPVARRMDPTSQGSSYSWRTPGSGSMDRAPSSGRGILKLNSSASLASTSTRSLQRFEEEEEEEEEKSTSRVGSMSSPSHRPHMSPLESIRARNASGGVRSSSIESMVKDTEDYVRRYRR
ncbi:hypothetical protein BG005_001652 [Podila minutissima]|nr:hypothetical protein BG005_001652 [Podila minutissima]